VSQVELDLDVIDEPADHIEFDLNGTGKAITNFAIILYGWSMYNVSTTTLATVNVYDGTDTSGSIVFPINLAANQSGRDWFGPGGIWFRNGLYLNVTAQEIKGSVFYRRHHGHQYRQYG